MTVMNLMLSLMIAEEEGEDLTHDMEQEHDEEEAMMENVQLQKVSVTR